MNEETKGMESKTDRLEELDVGCANVFSVSLNDRAGARQSKWYVLKRMLG